MQALASFHFPLVLAGIGPTHLAFVPFPTSAAFGITTGTALGVPVVVVAANSSGGVKGIGGKGCPLAGLTAGIFGGVRGACEPSTVTAGGGPVGTLG